MKISIRLFAAFIMVGFVLLILLLMTDWPRWRTRSATQSRPRQTTPADRAAPALPRLRAMAQRPLPRRRSSADIHWPTARRCCSSRPALRNNPGKLRRAAVMIHVVMSRDQMIYRRNSRLPHRLLDTFRVAPVKAGPTRVYRYRFFCGRDNERRRAAFDINVIDVECAARRFCLWQREAAYGAD